MAQVARPAQWVRTQPHCLVEPEEPLVVPGWRVRVRGVLTAPPAPWAAVMVALVALAVRAAVAVTVGSEVPVGLVVLVPVLPARWHWPLLVVPAAPAAWGAQVLMRLV